MPDRWSDMTDRLDDRWDTDLRREQPPREPEPEQEWEPDMPDHTLTITTTDPAAADRIRRLVESMPNCTVAEGRTWEQERADVLREVLRRERLSAGTGTTPDDALRYLYDWILMGAHATPNTTPAPEATDVPE